MGKQQGLISIEESIRKLVEIKGIEIEKATEYILNATMNDRSRYLEQVRTGEIELKFIPQGCTYFKQERWNDGNEEIDQQQILDARIDDEIIRARINSDMG